MNVNNVQYVQPNTDMVVIRVRQNPTAIKSLKQLYADKDETGDVCFMIGSERIRAHRCVLAAISSKFKTQFYGSQPDNGDVIVTGSTAAAFRKFIEFFYLDEIELSTEEIEGVLDLAKQSLVDEFVQLCVNFLIEVAPLDNVFLGYRLAILYDIDELKNLCELHTKKDTIKVFESEDFTNNCDRDSLLSVLKLDTLNCRETEVFDACIKWAMAACKRNNTDPEKTENLRLELDDVISEIRFGSMTIEEFAVRQRLYGQLFSHDEISEIIYLIGQVKDFKSEKFNQTPRNHSEKELQSIGCLECNRVISNGPDFRRLPYVKVLLRFTCNRSIRLEGCTVGCVSYVYIHARLESLNGVDVKNHSIKTAHKLEKEKNEMTIVFDEPVDVNRDKKVEIQFYFKSLETSKSYELANRVSLDDVTFVFNSPRYENHVTKLLYNLK